jgi:hypothetical protein
MPARCCCDMAGNCTFWNSPDKFEKGEQYWSQPCKMTLRVTLSHRRSGPSEPD